MLVLIASVLPLLAVIAVWAHDEVTDTDRFVASMAPLARNPDVQNALANRLTAAAIDQIDVKAVVNDLSSAAAGQGVPPRLAQLLGGLTGSAGERPHQPRAQRRRAVVTSDAFATVWETALRGGHAGMVKALTGQGGGTVQLKNDEVTVDIGPAVERVKAQLVDAGFGPASKIPAVHTDFVVFSSPDLAKVESGFRLLEVLGNWMPVVVVLVAAAGVLTAFNRRRALIGAGLGIGAAMLLLGIALAVFRAYFLDHLPADASPTAAAAVYDDALVTYLRRAVRVVGVLAVVVALGAFLIGPSRAVAGRRDRPYGQRSRCRRRPLGRRLGRVPGRPGGAVRPPLEALDRRRRPAGGRVGLRLLGPPQRRGGVLVRRGGAGRRRRPGVPRPQLPVPAARRPSHPAGPDRGRLTRCRGRPQHPAGAGAAAPGRFPLRVNPRRSKIGDRPWIPAGTEP
ncbi:hypothetical protein [Kitasatospora indigofera]|uniref:hypothetical protein n=1 Tax=Kitasatospora indigofera TaxID=67307 RepID=UPI0033B78031